MRAGGRIAHPDHARHRHDGRNRPALSRRQPAPGKTIVLTGAMVPYAFGSSDGLFNLGSALSFVQALSPGVFIAMNGRCFVWDRVRKNRETGVFEEAPDRTPRKEQRTQRNNGRHTDAQDTRPRGGRRRNACLLLPLCFAPLCPLLPLCPLSFVSCQCRGGAGRNRAPPQRLRRDRHLQPSGRHPQGGRLPAPPSWSARASRSRATNRRRARRLSTRV